MSRKTSGTDRNDDSVASSCALESVRGSVAQNRGLSGPIFRAPRPTRLLHTGTSVWQKDAAGFTCAPLGHGAGELERNSLCADAVVRFVQLFLEGPLLLTVGRPRTLGIDRHPERCRAGVVPESSRRPRWLPLPQSPLRLSGVRDPRHASRRDGTPKCTGELLERERLDGDETASNSSATTEQARHRLRSAVRRVSSTSESSESSRSEISWRAQSHPVGEGIERSSHWYRRVNIRRVSFHREGRIRPGLPRRQRPRGSPA